MEQEIRVRAAEPSDAPIIVEFNQRMAEETEGKRLATEILSAGVAAVFADKQRGFYVVAENEFKEVVGCLLITFEWSDWRNALFWWIQSVYVRADYRGKAFIAGFMSESKKWLGKMKRRFAVFGFTWKKKMKSHKMFMKSSEWKSAFI